MTLFEGIEQQLHSVIEWQNPDPNALFEQWTKSGANPD